MTKPEYIIGIDLGTTNCTLAYIDGGDTHRQIQQFAIPQITKAGSQDELFTLPSFIYFPLPEELKANMAAIVWDSDPLHCTGTYARDRGEEVPTRLIHSAKSWLCHSSIDRREKILPSLLEDPSLQMSPLQACAEYLRHLKEAWQYKMPDISFEEQQILITVPASFDPSARQLVEEAASLAGYPKSLLLEEPQAAFYDWLHRHDQEWRKLLKVGDCVLIVDIGGGTTDFSLIKVADEEGNLVLKRLAVGAHLLLGGDNLDLCLAYFAKNKFEEKGHSIDEAQFQSLIHVCRRAKEALLADNPPESFDVIIMGRGSKLIGNTLKTTLTRAEVEKLLIEGFFPLIEPEERSLTERRSGIQQIGLPYVQDPRISCQLAKFLSMTGETDQPTMDKFLMPTAVLFNGGTMKSATLRQRFTTLLNRWAKKLNQAPVQELAHPDYDFAVSKGAVTYGLSRKGQAIRIRSGTSRSYFIGVEDAAPAVPGIPTPLKAICIAPFGMEEGTELELPEREFALVLGQQTMFRFFSRSTPTLSNGTIARMGTVICNWKQELSELHPVETCLETAEGDGKTVHVKLKSRITELGVLELWCISHDKKREWKLEFDLRQQLQHLEKV